MDTHLKRKPTSSARKPRRLTTAGLEGTYIKVGQRTVNLTLKRGKFQWNENPWCGSYRATRPDEFKCMVRVVWKLFDCSSEEEYRITRRRGTYTFEELPSGRKTQFKREDGRLFLADSLAKIRQKPEAHSVVLDRKRQSTWRQIPDSLAKVAFYLTGESVVKGTTIPAPPLSKQPTLVRVTHSNSTGPVDSDVFIRLGDPRHPLGVQDFDTVSDWRRATLVEDLLWNDERNDWVLRGKAKGIGSSWSGTYEAEIQFPKGHHQIELKMISRVPEVCSIVLSNWKVYVR
jgi:hypothetical protein